MATPSSQVAGPTFAVVAAPSGGYQWVLVAAPGQSLSRAALTFETQKAAKRAVEQVRTLARTAQIVDDVIPARRSVFRVYADARGTFRWTLLSKKSPLAESDRGYATRRQCKANVTKVKATAPAAVPAVLPIPAPVVFAPSGNRAGGWGRPLVLEPLAGSFGTTSGEVRLLGAIGSEQVLVLAEPWAGRSLTVTLPATPPFPAPAGGYKIRVQSAEVLGETAIVVLPVVAITLDPPQSWWGQTVTLKATGGNFGKSAGNVWLVGTGLNQEVQVGAWKAATGAPPTSVPLALPATAPFASPAYVLSAQSSELTGEAPLVLSLTGAVEAELKRFSDAIALELPEGLPRPFRPGEALSFKLVQGPGGPQLPDAFLLDVGGVGVHAVASTVWSTVDAAGNALGSEIWRSTPGFPTTGHNEIMFLPHTPPPALRPAKRQLVADITLTAYRGLPSEVSVLKSLATNLLVDATPTAVCLFSEKDFAFGSLLFVAVPNDGTAMDTVDDIRSWLEPLQNLPRVDDSFKELSNRAKYFVGRIAEAGTDTSKIHIVKADETDAMLSRITDFWNYEYKPLPWRISAEDIMSSFIAIGESGRTFTLFNAPKCDYGEGALGVMVGPERVVICPDLKNRRADNDPVPQSGPAGALLWNPVPDADRPYDDTFSSMQFVKFDGARCSSIRNTVRSNANKVSALRERRKMIERDPDMDDDVKAEQLRKIDEAIAALQKSSADLRKEHAALGCFFF